jgi:surface carbohydrate biosynthesis protein (TIGR04326 family)
VARLARELIEQERINHTVAFSYAAVVRNLVEAGAAFERVVVPWEGHAWETALSAAVHEHLPGAAVVGYDNVNFSSLALSLYPGRAELGVRPLPDRVVANGPTFARILEGAGFPADRIRVGCALRHDYLAEIEPRERAEGYVLAAGTIDAAQTIELVETAHAAFGDDLVVKLHPAVDAARVRAAVSAPVRYEDRPIGELLGEARAMLYSYSVVAYEALAAGVPPVFVQSETYPDLDQLEPTPGLRQVARTPEELREAVRRTGELGPEWREQARAAVADALAPPGPGCVEAFL